MSLFDAKRSLPLSSACAAVTLFELLTRTLTMVKTKKIVLAKHFEGEPKLSDFKIIEEELPPIKDGEILCESLWLSVDPYMRLFMQATDKPTLAKAGIVTRIIESKAPEFPKGKYLHGYFDWQTMVIYNTSEKPTEPFPKPYLLPDFGDLPLSLGVGILGMPGITATLSFLEICDPKPGETVVVNAAAGAVGSTVGQIAKIKECRVIGFAGSDDKVKLLKDELCFNAAYNYKKVKISDALKEAAPNGVNCYFDSVGGTFSSEVYRHMRRKGRVTVVGAIEGYNKGLQKILVPMPETYILLHELKVEGFIIWNHFPRWLEAIKKNIRWIQEGKLVYRETITQGIENAPKAFIGMLKGENIGKAVVKI